MNDKVKAEPEEVTLRELLADVFDLLLFIGLFIVSAVLAMTDKPADAIYILLLLFFWEWQKSQSSRRNR